MTNPSVSTPALFHFQSKPIRTFTDNQGNSWFAGKDVALALGLSWSGHTLQIIPAEWAGVVRYTTPGNPGRGGGGTQNLKFINEPAVYKLAFRSNKPEADAFTNWVAGEVLPSIRKSGRFDPVAADQERRTNMAKQLFEAAADARAPKNEKDLIVSWIDRFWRDASVRYRCWFSVQFENAFVDYLRWRSGLLDASLGRAPDSRA